MASSATPVAFAAMARSTDMPRAFVSAIGILSAPEPLRLMTRSLDAAAMTVGEIGSTPASQPSTSGTSSSSSASPGISPAAENTSSCPAAVSASSSGGGAEVSERGVIRIRAIFYPFTAFCATSVNRPIVSASVPISTWKTSAMTCVQP